MSKRSKNSKILWTCSCSCLSIPFALILLITVAYFVRRNAAESKLFLQTENISLIETYESNSWPSNPRKDRFQNGNNKTWRIYPYSVQYVIPEDADFLVYASGSSLRGMIIDPAKAFYENIRYEFYRIIKTENDKGNFEVETKFLGSIHTNLYLGRHISVSPDGESIEMYARAVDSRSLGKFRNKNVLLIWKIGDNVVEKDIVDRNGNKIPIIIKTEEEIERELDEEYLKYIQEAKPDDVPEYVQNFNASPIDSTSIKLTWDRARRADSYRIRQEVAVKSGPASGSHYFSDIGSTGFSPREYIVTGLSPNTTYRFGIVPVNSKSVKETTGSMRTTEGTTVP